MFLIFHEKIFGAGVKVLFQLMIPYEILCVCGTISYLYI